MKPVKSLHSYNDIVKIEFLYTPVRNKLSRFLTLNIYNQVFKPLLKKPKPLFIIQVGNSLLFLTGG